MAIVIAGGGTPMEDTDFAVTSGTSTSITFPATPSDGDIIICQTGCRLTDTGGSEITLPTGFTATFQHDDFGNNTSPAAAMGYRIASSEASATYQVDYSGTVANADLVGYVITSNSGGTLSYDSLADDNVSAGWGTGTATGSMDVGFTCSEDNAACFGMAAMYGDSGGGAAATNSHTVNYDQNTFNAGFVSTQRIVTSAEQFATDISWTSARAFAGGIMVFVETPAAGGVGIPLAMHHYKMMRAS